MIFAMNARSWNSRRTPAQTVADTALRITGIWLLLLLGAQGSSAVCQSSAERAAVSVTAQAGDTVRVQVHVPSQGVASTIESYQGQISFDASIGTIRRAELPSGVVGSWHEAEPGQVRFAGAAVEGVQGEPLLVLWMSSRRLIRPHDFTVEMEEVVRARRPTASNGGMEQ